MSQYYIIQNSRYVDGDVVLLADKSKVKYSFWTSDPEDAQVFDDYLKASYALSSLRYNGPRAITVDEYNSCYAKRSLGDQSINKNQ